MRCLVILFALLALGACNSGKQRAADQIFLKKQLDIIQLLQKVSQPVSNQELQQLGANYDIGSNSHQYSNPIIVKYYAGAVKAGLVQPQGTAFSNSISQLRKEVSLLYRILLSANDYDTFLKTAAWARVHVNEGQFVKALSAAVLVREDTQGIILPPSYEVLPQLHLDSRIIQEAQQIATLGISQAIQNILIPVNYSSVVSPTEQQLAYFSQDPGLANYYAYINLIQYILGQELESQPQPLTQQQYQQQIVGQYLKAGQDQQSTIGHGAQFLFLHQQLLAHYELNRLSNGLGPIGNIDWTNVQAPYQPHLRNLNGLEFPGRSQNLQLQQQKKQLVQLVMSLEQRLMEAIDSGHVITPQGIFLSLYQPQGVNILGDLIEGCGRSVNPRYYGSLQAVAKKLLGNAPEVENIWDYTPSALELGQTAVRDPAFYLLFKKIVNIYSQYQESLPAYQFNDLVLPGVTIQNVEISQLVTLFNDDYIDLDAVTIQPGQTQQQQVQQHVMAHLKRLDHKPYQYQIVVHSEQSVPNAVVRVYLGPKFDYNGKPVSISHNRQLFVQLDQFIQNLQLGQNIITRNSQQAPGQSHDWPCVQNILSRVNGAIRSQEPFFITEPQQIFSFPARLSLPKGQPQGYPLQLLVVISGPGLQNVPHGPVIPEQQLTFQQQQFQIVSPDQYEQMKQQQAQLPLSAGIQQNLEVLPENWSTAQQQIEVLRNHYANVYTKYHGQYPNTQIQNPVGLGQDMVYRVKGVGSVPGAAVPLAAITPLSLAGQQIGGQGQQQMQSQQMQSQVPQQQFQQAQMTGQQAGGLPSQWRIPQGGQGQVLGQGLSQGLTGGQGTLAGQGLQGQQGLGVQGMQHAMQQGIQGVQQGVQGLRGVPASLLGAQAGIQGVQQVLSVPAGQPITIPYGRQGVAGVSAQTWQNLIQRIGIGSSGQQHNGGFQGIYGQPQTVQDQSVSDYFQNKPISEIIGGAISLDGKPLGWPLDRPLTAGALSVPNIFAMDVLVYHEGQPTNDITQ